MKDHISYKTQWKIRKFANDADFQNDNPFEESVIDGNVLLNEGITALLNLLIGAAETAYSQANAFLGVGTDATAESAADTGLGAGPVYVACDAAYPQIAGQTVTWRAVFDGATGNQAWNEFTVANANSDAGDNLNRKTSAQGTKTAGQTWTLDLSITFS
jgi:hypothetical protein